jgi:hypothetical protein
MVTHLCKFMVLRAAPIHSIDLAMGLITLTPLTTQRDNVLRYIRTHDVNEISKRNPVKGTVNSLECPTAVQDTRIVTV